MVNESFGFTRASAESSLYYLHDQQTGDIILCILEVDDLLITGNNDSLIAKFKLALQKKYGERSETGIAIAWEPLSSFLGVRIVLV